MNINYLTDELSKEAIARILTQDALEFVAELHHKFGSQRKALLRQREARQATLVQGDALNFRKDTDHIRQGDWKVGVIPADLEDRRVEITGPVDRKMMINALNSGASVFMADLEDSLSPTWNNITEGQANLYDAVRRTIGYKDEAKGKKYELQDVSATLVVRPRGWHLLEEHVSIDNKPVSASLFDFGLYLFHNAHELLQRDTGPYFYLPKLESSEEARLWNDVFAYAQERLGLASGTIKATILVETITAAFEMDEILYELRDHVVGMNAGRWDYIFSLIKKFRNRTDMTLPDRAQVTMTVPFMKTYAELLVKTCHRRGAHAIGGMAAFIPSRRDQEVNDLALRKVLEDKRREAGQGYDGTWVAHPDLVPVAKRAFDEAFGDRPHQKDVLRKDVEAMAAELLDINVEDGLITEEGIRNNISVTLQYLNAWLNGNGAVAIFNLMEDAATAEISRAQLWQWLHNQSKLDDGTEFSLQRYEVLREEEFAKLSQAENGSLQEAARLLDALVEDRNFTEFLTVPAYQILQASRVPS